MKGNKFKVYSKYGNASCNYNHYSVTENLLLGCYQNSSGVKGRYFTGSIQDCKIYNEALTVDEINTYIDAIPETPAYMKITVFPNNVATNNNPANQLKLVSY